MPDGIMLKRLVELMVFCPSSSLTPPLLAVLLPVHAMVANRKANTVAVNIIECL
ncbi:12342_t:CDS:2 [Rhizophagus irregularis]|nr:12342_t:CDS:2 [Rhizophagus irregularis]